MNKNDQNFAAQRIRDQYMEKTPSKVDELRKLDAQVKKPANVFGYVFGSVGAVVMGSGMSLVMTDIGATVGISHPIVSGIIIGVAGLAMAIINYPIYKGILTARKQKYADEIIRLSDKIINE